MNAQTNAQVQRAIAEGKAFLNTAWGRKRVKAYRHDTGWAVTREGWQQRSFLICVSDVEIEN